MLLPKRKAHKNAPDPPTLPGTYHKFVWTDPALQVLHPDPIEGPGMPYLSSEAVVLMHMPKPGGQTRVAVEERATAEDFVETPTGAPSMTPLGAPSETTPERPESPDEVTGLIERLNISGTASNSDRTTVAGEGEGGARETAVERAQTLKTEGNQHFSAGDYSRALPLYSEAVGMLKGAGEDAALATILCNRSVAYLKLGQPDSALADAERAGSLGGGKAHFRRAEALFFLRRYEQALEAYEAALENAVSDCTDSFLEHACCPQL